MKVGDEMLALARMAGRRSLFVVGTGKNVGKTVAMRAVADAAVARGLRVGLTSMGRDGEAVDVADSLEKPRLFLQPGTVAATARGLLPAHPASEILGFTDWATAAGPVTFVRAARPGFYEIAGPPTAAGIRDCVAGFGKWGCEQVIVDGALDRVAALAGGDDSVILAVGANTAATLEETIEVSRALALRLRTGPFDPSQPSVHVAGALTAAEAARFIAAGERRQVVVRDPTRIALAGKAFLGASARLRLRCERPLSVVAVTVASVGRDRYYEPRTFARAVARATGLPAFDVYTGAMVAA